MAKRVLAAGRLFGLAGTARVKVAPGEDMVRATSGPWSLAALGSTATPLDTAFRIADRKLMALVHESRGRRRG